jgi:hypothetical protein
MGKRRIHIPSDALDRPSFFFVSVLELCHCSANMRLHTRLDPKRYEPRAQERSAERKSEARQIERLSAILAQKANRKPLNRQGAA